MTAKGRKEFEGRPLRLVEPGASRKAGEGFARQLVSFFSDPVSKGARLARGLGAPPALYARLLAAAQISYLQWSNSPLGIRSFVPAQAIRL
jgi:hypothetical protein